MPVGHGGCMSKHTTWEKVIILELLERRLKWAVKKADVPPEYVHVFDPFTTDMDFFIYFEKVSWDQYLMIYRWYYDEDLPAYDESYTELPSTTTTARVEIERVLKAENIERLSEAVYKKYVEAFPKALTAIKEYDEKEIFNASTSNTMILYTVQEMKNILECGKPDGCP